MSKRIIKNHQVTPTSGNIIDSLSSTSTTDGLSAKQGNYLYNLIQNLDIRLDNLSEEFDTKRLYINGTIFAQDPNATPDPQDPTNIDFGSLTFPGNIDYQSVFSGDGYHNSIFRGKNLTSVYTFGEVSQIVASGSFNDLYIGDYFNTNVNGVDIRLTIAGFNLFKREDDSMTKIDQNHIVMVCDCVNTTALPIITFEDGYYSIQDNLLGTFANNLKTSIGSSHVYTHYQDLSSWIEYGEVSSLSSKLVDCCLMTEINVFGTQIYDNIGLDAGFPSVQFPLFRLNPSEICREKKPYWLRNISDINKYCRVQASGMAGVNNYTSTTNYIKPYFLFK